jgi:predicted transcriptional regulator
MTSKDIAIKTIQGLRDSATWEDIEERVRFLSGIDKGLADIKAGRVVAHEDVKKSFKKWLAGSSAG